MFFVGSLFSWLGFASIYVVIQNYYKSSCNSDTCMTDEFDNSTICVSGIDSFNGALLYSLEVQSTIGYGSRALHSSGCYLHVIAYVIQVKITLK